MRGIIDDIFYVNGKPYLKYEIERVQSIKNPLSSVDEDMLKMFRVISQVFRDVKDRYCIIGRSAVAVYGRPLVTRDIDILIDVEEVDLKYLERQFDKYGLNPSSLKFLLNGQHVTILTNTPYRLDLTPALIEGQKLQVKNAVIHKVRGVEVRVSSVEELIPWLIKYERFEDAAYLLINYRKLSWERINVIAKELNIENDLQEVKDKVEKMLEKKG